MVGGQEGQGGLVAFVCVWVWGEGLVSLIDMVDVLWGYARLQLRTSEEPQAQQRKK